MKYQEILFLFPLVKDIVLSECQLLLTLSFLYQSILPTKR